MHQSQSALFQSFLAALSVKERGDLPRARKALEGLVAHNPNFVPAHVELGILLAESGNAHEAERHLRMAVRLAPDDPKCLSALAHHFCIQSNWEEALTCYEHLLEKTPKDLSLLKKILAIYRQLHKFECVIRICERIRALGGESVEVMLAYIDAAKGLGRRREVGGLGKALVANPGISGGALLWLAEAMVEAGQADELLAGLVERARLEKFDVVMWRLVASAHISQLKYVQAKEALLKAYEIEAKNVLVMHDLAVTCQFLGQNDEAKKWLEAILEEQPDNAEAWRLWGEYHKYARDDESLERLKRFASQTNDVSIDQQVQFQYALGKALEDVDDIAGAMRCYSQAGRMHLISHPLDLGADHYLEFVEKIFDGGAASPPLANGCESDLPVFVMGMPRSGTSLVEQMLVSHPDVQGVGEVDLLMRALDGLEAGSGALQIKVKHPFFPVGGADNRLRGEGYVEALRKLVPEDCKRIVDKLPGNYVWAGFIQMILPNARIIHCRRHPIETCLSAFRIYFAEGNSHSADLSTMAKLYRRYDEQMNLWRKIFGASRNYMEVRYEDLVNDFEAQSRRLVEFVGLEWDARCLRFYENERPVSTASALQVRKPIYRDRLNRWHKYKPYLLPLIDMLDDIVKAYEAELTQQCLKD